MADEIVTVMIRGSEKWKKYITFPYSFINIFLSFLSFSLLSFLGPAYVGIAAASMTAVVAQ